MDRPTIKVKALKGKVIPIPNGVAVNTAGRTFTAETAVEVYADSLFIRRALKPRRNRDADLVEVKAPAKKEK